MTDPHRHIEDETVVSLAERNTRADFERRINELEDEFVTIEFDQRLGEKLVFKREELLAATEEIVTDNGIRYTTSDDLRDLAVDRDE